VRKLPVIVLVLAVLGGFHSFAQTLDSARVEKVKHVFDSLENKSRFQFAVDSFKIVSWSDSLKNRVGGKFSLDSIHYQAKIDSLARLQLPTSKYTQKLDSLRSKKDQMISEVQVRREELLSKTRNRMQAWQSRVREKLGMGDLAGKLPSGQLPGEVQNATGKIGDLQEKLSNAEQQVPGISELNIPDTGLPQLPNADLGNLDLPEMPELSIPEMKDINLSPDLSSINEKINFGGLDQLDGIKEKLGGATEQIDALKNISSDPDKAITTTLENVQEVGALKEELAGVDALKNNEFMETAEMLKNPETIKTEVVEKAVNHFAGKEEVLQQAMQTMAKYKQKYESLNSLSDIKKRPPNPLKGKPFVERLLPGVGLQVLRNDDLFLDVNPYIGYRIYPRLTAGAGWNQRIGFSLEHHYFTSPSVIYGPRAYVEFKTWRGFVLRLEGELMNTRIPPTIQRVLNDTDERDWVKTAFIGVKKEYRFLKNVKGTAFVMCSIYNDHRKSPYGDVVNSRFGFEFPLKKKARS
jgi:hypothetical protein